MEELAAWLVSDNGQNVHIAVFSLLLLGGIGFPMPEDIPLLLGGVAIAHGITPLGSMFAICYIGVLIGDQILYGLGYFYGKKLLNAGTNSTFFPSITEERVQEVREGLRKRRLLYILLSRHLFPIRSSTFISAGALHVPYFEFLIADAFAALLSVALMLSIGSWLGHKFSPEEVRAIAEQSHPYIMGFVLAMVAIVILRYMRKRKKRLIAEQENSSNQDSNIKEESSSEVA